MKIYRGIENISPIDGAVLTTGTFDGVHAGHQAIIRRLIEAAKAMGGQSVLLTFDPHPRYVLKHDANDLRLLNTLKEKEILLEKAGIDHLIIVHFTKEFSETAAETFIKDLLVKKIGVKKMVIGYDHRFGKGRGGSFKELAEMSNTYGFETEEIPAEEIDRVAVSSTKIRNALASGDLAAASEWLGYEYSITGTVIQGNQLGRTLGFPTANIKPDDEKKLIPAGGVYAAKVLLNGQILHGMLNIGSRPTVQGSKEQVIEVNIFDFNEDIYGKEICIIFVEKLRDEIKFENLRLLKNQLETDKLNTLNVFRKHEI